MADIQKLQKFSLWKAGAFFLQAHQTEAAAIQALLGEGAPAAQLFTLAKSLGKRPVVLAAMLKVAQWSQHPQNHQFELQQMLRLLTNLELPAQMFAESTALRQTLDAWVLQLPLAQQRAEAVQEKAQELALQALLKKRYEGRPVPREAAAAFRTQALKWAREAYGTHPVKALEQLLLRSEDMNLVVMRNTVAAQLGGSSPLGRMVYDHVIAQKWGTEFLVNVSFTPATQVFVARDALVRAARVNKKALTPAQQQKLQTAVDTRLAQWGSDEAKLQYLRELAATQQRLPGKKVAAPQLETLDELPPPSTGIAKPKPKPAPLALRPDPGVIGLVDPLSGSPLKVDANGKLSLVDRPLVQTTNVMGTRITPAEIAASQPGATDREYRQRVGFKVEGFVFFGQKYTVEFWGQRVNGDSAINIKEIYKLLKEIEISHKSNGAEYGWENGIDKFSQVLAKYLPLNIGWRVRLQPPPVVIGMGMFMIPNFGPYLEIPDFSRLIGGDFIHYVDNDKKVKYKRNIRDPIVNYTDSAENVKYKLNTHINHKGQFVLNAPLTLNVGNRVIFSGSFRAPIDAGAVVTAGVSASSSEASEIPVTLPKGYVMNTQLLIAINSAINNPFTEQSYRHAGMNKMTKVRQLLFSPDQTMGAREGTYYLPQSWENLNSLVPAHLRHNKAHWTLYKDASVGLSGTLLELFGGQAALRTEQVSTPKIPKPVSMRRYERSRQH
jgi:hypothetical protein